MDTDFNNGNDPQDWANPYSNADPHDWANPYSDTPASPPPLRSRPRLLGRMPSMALAGGIVAGLILGGTGIGFAVASTASGTSPSSSSGSSSSGSSSSNTAPSKPSTAPWAYRGDGPGRLGPLGLGMLGGGIVHGTVTVHNGSGYKTIEIQTGTVSSVSSSQITVASPDGYTHTYTVVPATTVNSQANGIGSVSKTDQVTITASPSNGKDTATSIVDQTKLKDSRQSFGFAPPGVKPAPTPPNSSGSGAPA